MNEFPEGLLAALPEAALPAARQWWASLVDADRSRIADLWDNRLEVSFFAPQADASGRVDEWDQVPAVEGGRFVPHDDRGLREWGPGYFEHLLQHPELVLAYSSRRLVRSTSDALDTQRRVPVFLPGRCQPTSCARSARSRAPWRGCVVPA